MAYFFTVYEPTSANARTPDPLGFMMPTAALADLLFPQFTVNSTHPCYLGLFCYVLQYLYTTKKVTARRGGGIAREFRKYEIPWGLACLSYDREFPSDGPGVLNINRYKKIECKNSERGDWLPENKNLFSILGYGAYGFYRRPAISWGLLDEYTGLLTSRGIELAQAWEARGNDAFSNFLKTFTPGKTFDIDSVVVLHRYALNAAPDPREQEVWRKIISDNIADLKNKETQPLWDDPVPVDMPTSEKAEHYKNHHQKLSERLLLCHQLEIIYALSMLLFEGCYAALWNEMIHKTGGPSFNQSSRDLLRDMLSKAVNEYQKAYPKNIPSASCLIAKNLEKSATFEDMMENICQAHHEHQDRKNAYRFMENGKILLTGRIDHDRVNGLIEEINTYTDNTQILNAARQYYGRDWYFSVQKRWLDYSKYQGDGSHV